MDLTFQVPMQHCSLQHWTLLLSPVPFTTGCCGAAAATAQDWPRGATPRPRSGTVAALCWSSCEEIPHVQGKRNPSKTVCAERGHQRADRLKPQSQTTSQSDHMEHSLSNSMKLSHAVWGHPGRTGHSGGV